MSKKIIYFSAILSTLLLSGIAVADRVQNDLQSDMMKGHTPDHMDSALMNSSKAQAPNIKHSDGKDGTDMIHQMSVDKRELNSSPSSPPDLHHASDDDSPNIVHEVTKH